MLIGLQNVTFEFGARVIIEDASWHVFPGERIGLIGYNGTGKSTILKLLVGEYKPSSGTVEKSKETTIGYLHQDLLSFDSNDTILRVTMGAFERVMELEYEIDKMGKELEVHQTDELLHKYSDLLHEMDVLDGYNIQYKTEEVLHGLGFSTEDFEKPYKQFSGGWRMRVLLAKMILQQPDVLLLDEPTNHLDLPSIEWLEKYLLGYKGSVIIVSHDKFFLNRMVNKVVEVYQQQLHFYSGNYEYYETEKELRVTIQQRAYENQQDYIRQQERFIERFKAKASKAAQAQSVMKRLDKIDKIEQTEIERPDIRINFKIDTVPGKIICTLNNITKKFGENTIVGGASAEINRGDKIALIGANGKGKSTLLRIVANTEPFEGERIWGHNVVENFYAQHQLEALNMQNNILEEMQQCGSGKTDQELRALLGGFLFGGDDVDKKIKVLSGGEKARVALAKVIAGKSNFMLLDEPTNHLDMHSVELLAEALNKYEGSYLLVSHDRFFISKTATKIWEIVDHEIKEFKGGYTEYIEWKKRMDSQKSPKESNKKQEPIKPIITEVKETKVEYDANKVRDMKRDLLNLQKKLSRLEDDLNKNNSNKQQIEIDLGNPDIYSNHVKFAETEKAYQAVLKTITDLDKQYEKLFEEVMEKEESLKGL